MLPLSPERQDWLKLAPLIYTYLSSTPLPYYAALTHARLFKELKI